MLPLIHLNYDIDKEKYRNLFYDNLDLGQWHWLAPKRRDLFWYQLFIPDDSPLKEKIQDVEMDLGIYGMNNFPRFSHQFANSRLEPHVDEDKMVTILINLMEKTEPTIHIESKPYKYQCAFVDVGHKVHAVEPDPNNRLILKFCLRHSYEEVYERLDRFGLIDE